ncbi:hypothetical protein PTSG_10264 [Salpingoeca rosetta]|uniref:Uncharacterized protein n=1 Tax=Salpingoeca rosetta (strain ATCC 50818 / BSB-021) TaxID=946362 RepID=F2UQS8_SALR5|nr:uncharacterized protein PTSG_10264 [Salpingoeca rosetta]EGD79983.1 hypothetical protein PTSG_10264 [Salpingoeca rosetta]|eukprot:XP_004988604.1 hypothetical protein PTSG_10264 [Salpingoeca rosetta]
MLSSNRPGGVVMSSASPRQKAPTAVAASRGSHGSPCSPLRASSLRRNTCPAAVRNDNTREPRNSHTTSSSSIGSSTSTSTSTSSYDAEEAAIMAEEAENSFPSAPVVTKRMPKLQRKPSPFPGTLERKLAELNSNMGGTVACKEDEGVCAPPNTPASRGCDTAVPSTAPGYQQGQRGQQQPQGLPRSQVLRAMRRKAKKPQFAPNMLSINEDEDEVAQE